MDSNHGTLNNLVRRLERLERENRRLKRAGLIAALALVAVGVMGQTTVTEVIEAQRFVVRDANGITRAELKSGGLDIQDTEGRVRASFSINPMSGEPIILFKDSAGRTRARLEIVFGSPSLRFLDEKSQDRFESFLKGDGSAALRIRDGDGKVVWKVP